MNLKDYVVDITIQLSDAVNKMTHNSVKGLIVLKKDVYKRQVLDRFMIGIITNNTIQIGYYEQAQKIVKLALTLVTSLSTVMSVSYTHLIP